MPSNSNPLHQLYDLHLRKRTFTRMLRANIHFFSYARRLELWVTHGMYKYDIVTQKKQFNCFQRRMLLYWILGGVRRIITSIVRPHNCRFLLSGLKVVFISISQYIEVFHSLDVFIHGYLTKKRFFFIIWLSKSIKNLLKSELQFCQSTWSWSLLNISFKVQFLSRPWM